jgi:uncharacterized protein (DUF1786 family)
MGGGPSTWAAEAHLKRGLAVYATPEAARTFDDELPRVEHMGIRVVSDDEASRLVGVVRIRLSDFDLSAIAMALAPFDVDFKPAAVALAVFDHGNAPPGVSDRIFRFAYLAETVVQNDLAAFGYRREDLPARLTRMRSAAEDVPAGLPTFVMDTGPAAVLGALEDPYARGAPSALVANVGNFHTLAFHIAGGRILGIFEHHTGELTRAELERYLGQLGDGTISNEEVFADMGHGALVVGEVPVEPKILAVTGPRRALLQGSAMQPYLAVPHGAMMLAGCYGMLRGMARRMPEYASAILPRLLN